MTYAYPAWKLAADTYVLKLQRLQNKVLCTIGNFPTYTSVRDLYTGFNLLYAYDYITKLCRRQAEVIQNHDNEHKSYKIMRMNMFLVQDKAKPDIESIRGLNLTVVKLTTVQMTKLLL
jgi:hypothetical protein